MSVKQVFPIHTNIRPIWLMMLDQHDGWYRALKLGIKAYPSLWHQRPWFPFRNPGSDWAVVLDVLVFPNWTFSNWTVQDATRQIVNSGPDWILSVQDLKYMTLEYFLASGKVAYRSDRTWNCFSPEILNLLNTLISSGDQRKMRIAATLRHLQWVYRFYPHDRPDLNANSPLF